MNIKLSQVTVHLPPSGRFLFRISEFEVAPGAKLLIEGASGKGKTTLLHLMAGLFSPTQGYVFYDEQNIKYLSEEVLCQKRRDHFGIVFQKLNLLDHLTALENVMLTLPRGESFRDLALESLAALQVADKENERAGSLSLGEQQRVAVARVLAKKPNVVLADEPTSSLDDQNAELVIDKLLSGGKDQTVVVVSHDGRLRRRFSNVLNFSDLVGA